MVGGCGRWWKELRDVNVTTMKLFYLPVFDVVQHRGLEEVEQGLGRCRQSIMNENAKRKPCRAKQSRKVKNKEKEKKDSVQEGRKQIEKDQRILKARRYFITPSYFSLPSSFDVL